MCARHRRAYTKNQDEYRVSKHLAAGGWPTLVVVADEPLKKVCVYAGMRCDRGRDDRTRRDGSDTFSCYATLLTACESGMQARPRAAVSKSRTGDGHTREIFGGDIRTLPS